MGSILFEDQPGWAQVGAATTNGTSASQTFGITTGTSNCKPDGLIGKAEERNVFAQQNYPALVKEMAMGEGESLGTLASLFGCSQESNVQFGAMVQNNYANIIVDENTSSDEMLISVQHNLRNDSALSNSCNM